MVASSFKRAQDLPQVIPVFPLDGALLLPHGALPLNIFEPRYLNMFDDAMSGERIIGMVQTRPGGDAMSTQRSCTSSPFAAARRASVARNLASTPTDADRTHVSQSLPRGAPEPRPEHPADPRPHRRLRTSCPAGLARDWQAPSRDLDGATARDLLPLRGPRSSRGATAGRGLQRGWLATR